MRGLLGFFCVLASIALVIAILLTSVQMTVTNLSFYDRTFLNMDTAKSIGMSHNELMRVTDHLLRYMAGKEESLQIKAKFRSEIRNAFDERESLHMVDVAALYQNAMLFRNIALVAIAIVVLLTIVGLPTDRIRLLAKCYLMGFSIAGALFAGLTVWILLDFETFWTNFHYLFFSNDLWLLDPRTSLMINMFPLAFWSEVCRRIVVMFAVGAGTLLAASGIYLKYRDHRRKRLMSIHEGTADN